MSTPTAATARSTRNRGRPASAPIATSAISATITASVPTTGRPDPIAAAPAAIVIATRLVIAADIADVNVTVIATATNNAGAKRDQRQHADGD
jgi:hypothetical protein